MKNEEEFCHIRYINNVRYRQVIESLDISSLHDKKASYIKRKGIYIIVGGAGGLGGTLAAHLAQFYQGNHYFNRP